MKKIPTLFRRNPEDMRHVLDEVHPDCQWVIDGEGVPTRKFDGTCVLIRNGSAFTRREVKPGKAAPPNFTPIDHDEATGKTVGWEPAEQSGFWKFIQEAMGAIAWGDGTYELCGPKIQGNPEGFEGHTLVRHGAQVLGDVPLLNYDNLRDYLLALPYEGIVWHHPDGRMAKLKRRDFT